MNILVTEILTPNCNVFLFAGDPCTVEGSTRLIGGASDMEGRVEYCNNGRWGTVCNRIGWDSLDAMVVCRELGHYALGMHLRSIDQ